MTPESAPTDAPLPEPPETGRFTFVFTDIEGSSKITRRLEDLHGSGKYEELRDRQRDVLLKQVHANDGWEASRAGDGHFFVFAHAKDAFNAVVAFQQEVARNPIETELDGKPVLVTVRVGIHTCRKTRNSEKTTTNGRDLYEFPGSDTNFAARVGGVGAGGQVLTSESFVRELWGDAFIQAFGRIEMNDRPAPPSTPLPILGVRCWPSRALKSFEDEASNHLYEILYDEETRAKKREPGSRFFPEFYIDETNRYIGRPDEEANVYAALGLHKTFAPADGLTYGSGKGGALVLVQAEGGMGKTRLAVTCAVRAASEFTDGVYFARLSLPQNEAERGVGGEEFLVGRLFAALPAHRQTAWGLTRGPQGELPPLSVIVDVLKTRRALLVLDNFESLVPEVADAFLQALFPSELHVLLTTRIDPDVTSLGQTVLLQDGMDENAAMELAITRLRQKKGANWNPTPDDETHLREIIHLTGFPLTTQAAAQNGEPPRYGAIPLAVELAVGSLGAKAHLSEVVAGLRVSPLGMYSASSANWDDAREYKRHHSVTHTLDWSYGLLGENAKRTFAASGLFAASFEADALLKTANADASILSILVGNSLLRLTGDGRYILHSITRAYARVCLLGGLVVSHIDRREGAQTEERPARNDAQEICQRFVHWYSAFVKVRLDGNGDLKMNTPEEREDWETESENFIAASEILCGTSPALNNTPFLLPSFADRLLGGFGSYLERIGAWNEEEAWYRRFATFTRRTKQELDYGWAIHQLANVYHRRGFYNQAVETYKESLEVSRKRGKQPGADAGSEAASLHGLANVYNSLGRYQHAINAYNDSLVVLRTINNPQGEAANLYGLANIYNRIGRYQEAIQAYQKSGDISHSVGDKQGEAAVLHGLANVYNRLRRYNEAIRAYQNSLEIKRTINDVAGESASLHGLANVYEKQERYDEAITAYKDSLEIKRILNDPLGEAVSLHGLALVYSNTGRYDEAINAYNESLEIARKFNNPQGEAMTLGELGSVFFEQGRTHEAITHVQDAADRLLQLGDNAMAGVYLGNLAYFQATNGQYAQAIETTHQAIAAYAKTQDEKGKQEAAQLLADLQSGAV